MKNTLLFEIEIGDNPTAHFNYIMMLKIGLFAIKDTNLYLLFNQEMNERKAAFLANFQISNEEFDKLEKYYLRDALYLITEGINTNSFEVESIKGRLT